MTFADMCSQAVKSTKNFGESDCEYQVVSHVKSPIFDSFSGDKFVTSRFSNNFNVKDYSDRRSLDIYRNITD